MILCYAALKPRDEAGKRITVNSATYQPVVGHFKGKATHSTLVRGRIGVDGVTDRAWGALWLPKELDAFFSTLVERPDTFAFRMVDGEPMPNGTKTYQVDLLSWSGSSRVIDDADELAGQDVTDEDAIGPRP